MTKVRNYIPCSDSRNIVRFSCNLQRKRKKIRASKGIADCAKTNCVNICHTRMRPGVGGTVINYSCRSNCMFSSFPSRIISRKV